MKNFKMIKAESPKAPLNLIDGTFSITAAAADEKKTRRFDIVGYTGGVMRLGGWYYPVVVALDGISFNASTPVYINHSGDYDMNYILGQTDKVEISKGKVLASGPVMGESDEVKKVLALADKGFNWQASIGARPDQTEFISEGKSVKVNGQSFDGPINVVHKSTLYEISFVARGADNNTSANIAAGNNFFDKEFIMKEKLVLAIMASAKNTLTKEQLDAKSEDELKAMAKEIGVEAKADAKPKADEKPAAVEAKASNPQQAGDDDVVTQIRARSAAEFERINKVRDICAGQHNDIEAKAIKEGWNEDKTTLEVLRASRHSDVSGISSEQQQSMPKLLEAAAMMSGGISPENVIKVHGEQTVEAARKLFKSGIGLQQLLVEAAAIGGYQHRGYGLRATADIERVLRAAFSTISIPGILSNIANKFMLEAFMAVEQTWRKIARIRPVRDFKTITSYRMTGALEFEEVGPTGELKHGTLSEESFTNKAKTHGKLITVTREDIINDDLGALTDRPRMLGRGGILKLNKVFWAKFLANSDFFKTANKNYASGTATALGVDGLTAAELLFLNQIDAKNNPLGVTPKILLVPNALNALGSQLMKALELRDTTSSTKYPTSNPHAGKFEVERSSYLSDTTLTGYSTKAWYLLASPEELAAIEVVFLNGQETPIIESADADFNTLGVQLRGYYDFGCELQEHRAGVKMKGEN